MSFRKDGGLAGVIALGRQGGGHEGAYSPPPPEVVHLKAIFMVVALECSNVQIWLHRIAYSGKGMQQYGQVQSSADAS
jgi:NAD(P)H-dependent flavin oxidoreductase YrpB (nitropropane dioxygenase family)